MTRSKKPKRGGKPRTVRGDQQTIGNISDNAIVVQGRNATVTVYQGIQGTELAPLFDKIYQTIAALPDVSSGKKQELEDTARRIETEVAENGAQANQTDLQRWMENIQKMAPDIVDVILASLGGPLSAATAILKKIAERAKQAGSA